MRPLILFLAAAFALLHLASRVDAREAAYRMLRQEYETASGWEHGRYRIVASKNAALCGAVIDAYNRKRHDIQKVSNSERVIDTIVQPRTFRFLTFRWDQFFYADIYNSGESRWVGRDEGSVHSAIYIDLVILKPATENPSALFPGNDDIEFRVSPPSHTGPRKSGPIRWQGKNFVYVRDLTTYRKQILSVYDLKSSSSFDEICQLEARFRPYLADARP